MAERVFKQKIGMIMFKNTSFLWSLPTLTQVFCRLNLLYLLLSPNSYVETLTPNMIAPLRWGHSGVTRLCRGEALMSGIRFLIYEFPAPSTMWGHLEKMASYDLGSRTQAKDTESAAT